MDLDAIGFLVAEAEEDEAEEEYQFQQVTLLGTLVYLGILEDRDLRASRRHLS